MTWTTCLLPALAGDPETALENLTTLLQRTSRDDTDALVLAARTFFALGRNKDAETCLGHALTDKTHLGALTLAAFLGRAPVARVAARIQSEGQPSASDRADRAADLVALQVLAGDTYAAGVTLSEALCACPHHAELGRWRRFFAQTPAPLMVELARQRTRGTCDEAVVAHICRTWRPEHGASVERSRADAQALLPTADQGWLCAERVARRLATGDLDRSALAPQALGLLRTVGVTELRFGDERLYATLRIDHPLVELEIQADRLESLLDEGRPAEATARDLAEKGRNMPDDVTMEVVSFLAVNGFQNATIAEVALPQLSVLLREWSRNPNRQATHREQQAWLRACQARLLVTTGELRRARALAAELPSCQPSSPSTWLLMLEALRLVGDARGIDEAFQVAARAPELADLATSLRQEMGM